VSGEIIVVGGGVSGLAAAVSLASHGQAVRLLEQSPKLGGRCYSYADDATGDTVDNGQHVLVGAYHETLRYLDLIGTRAHLREYRSIPFFRDGGGVAGLDLGEVPAPFHLLNAVAGYGHLSIGEKAGVLRVGMFLRSARRMKDDRLRAMSVEEWLDSLGQSDGIRACLWHPVCISVMNERPRQASAFLFASALRATFLGSAADARMLIPAVGQTELYVGPAKERIAAAGGEVVTGAEVAGIDFDNGRVSAVRLASGALIPARAVIASVPPQALLRILPGATASGAPFAGIAAFGVSPIVSVHLWFDRETLSLPFVGLVGRRTQWLFDRRRILGGVSGGHPVSAVISAAYDEVDLSKEELVSIVREDLGAVAPGSREARLLSSVVIKEKRATFSATASSERLRPGVRTPVGGLYLAGDWTDTGLPATIEGAVASGFRAARAVLADL
jgi:squalene-associated FAD-dependent desaturase